ncbi:MAG: crossover junction endodeoxyribonuclease RuvC [Patescibacteria group bacterium]
MTTPAKKYILGFDPGIGRLGFAVLSGSPTKPELIEVGCFETNSKSPQNQRLAQIGQFTKKLIKKYQPDKAGLEKLFFSKNVKSALNVAEARGVISLLLTEQNCPILELSPQEVKIAATGQGRADKTQVQKMLQLTFSLKKIPQPDDAADALAVALAALVQPKFLANIK